MMMCILYTNFKTFFDYLVIIDINLNYFSQAHGVDTTRCTGIACRRNLQLFGCTFDPIEKHAEKDFYNF